MDSIKLFNHYRSNSDVNKTLLNFNLNIQQTPIIFINIIILIFGVRRYLLEFDLRFVMPFNFLTRKILQTLRKTHTHKKMIGGKMNI